MNRRDALRGLAALPFGAGAPAVVGETASRPRRIGWLLTGVDLSPSLLDGHFPLLRRRGWVPGKTVAYEFRAAPFQQPELLERYARELVQLNVDVIVTYGDPATFAAGRATSVVPIVFTSTSDPVAKGFVASLGRPGGNVTGYAMLTEEVRVKRFEALRELIPQARTLAILVYGARTAESAKREARDEKVYGALGLRVVFVYAPTQADTEAAIDDAARQRVDAILLEYWYDNPSTVVKSLARNRLPAVGWDPRMTEAGGLLSVSTDEAEREEMVADLVDRILRGAKPGDLAVRQATRFEIVVNAKTARTLGLRVPPSLLARARVVE